MYIKLRFHSWKARPLNHKDFELQTTNTASDLIVVVFSKVAEFSPFCYILSKTFVSPITIKNSSLMMTIEQYLEQILNEKQDQ